LTKQQNLFLLLNLIDQSVLHNKMPNRALRPSWLFRVYFRRRSVGMQNSNECNGWIFPPTHVPLLFTVFDLALRLLWCIFLQDVDVKQTFTLGWIIGLTVTTLM
jgi:hypothetical protein